jgi:hypothetical protein
MDEVRDQQKRGLALDAARLTAATLNEDSYEKAFMKSLTRDDFDAHEDAFLNLLVQSFGVLKEP